MRICLLYEKEIQQKKISEVKLEIWGEFRLLQIIMSSAEVASIGLFFYIYHVSVYSCCLLQSVYLRVC